MQKFWGVALALAALIFVGCSNKPAGFPKVKLCEITVVDGGTPVEGVEIALISANPLGGVITGGRTDKDGKCVVLTTFANFSAPGVPEGEFVVTLKKDPTPNMPELTAEQMGEMTRPEYNEYMAARNAEIESLPRIVPLDLTDAETTPIKVVVPADSKLTVDLAQYE